MKNIHILPTPNPSRLCIREVDNKLCLHRPEVSYHGQNQNIYITNDEEIKNGDWTLKFPFGAEIFKNIEVGLNEYVKREKLHTYPYDWCKKIILTTDPDLIKDGIQKIDDEFLEWFVKNNICEEIKITVRCEKPTCHNRECNIICQELKYSIILSKEESKQDFPMQKLIDIMEADEELKPKETLEEAVENWLYNLENTNPLVIEKGYPWIPMKFGFIEGTKYQQENSYSEEDMRKMYDKSCGLIGLHLLDNQTENDNRFKELFEQFKKK